MPDATFCVTCGNVVEGRGERCNVCADERDEVAMRFCLASLTGQLSNPSRELIVTPDVLAADGYLRADAFLKERERQQTMKKKP